MAPRRCKSGQADALHTCMPEAPRQVWNNICLWTVIEEARTAEKRSSEDRDFVQETDGSCLISCGRDAFLCGLVYLRRKLDFCVLTIDVLGIFIQAYTFLNVFKEDITRIFLQGSFVVR